MSMCIFVYNNAHKALNSRIQIMSMIEAESLEQQGVGRILLTHKKLEKPLIVGAFSDGTE